MLPGLPPLPAAGKPPADTGWAELKFVPDGGGSGTHAGLVAALAEAVVVGGGGRPRLVLVVGPVGAGKTTLLAAVAAR